jgi:hypothetical protein
VDTPGPVANSRELWFIFAATLLIDTVGSDGRLGHYTLEVSAMLTRKSGETGKDAKV